MSTLREAAQQALEALKDCVKALDALHAPGDSIYTRASDSADRAEIALTAALAQQEQAEPVLVVEKEPDYMSRGHFYEGSKPFIDPTEVWKLPIGTKLYAHPPRREWQGLTNEEIYPLYNEPRSDAEMLEFAAAIEVKLKEKNA
jgi:hypothetical protein